MVAVLVDEGGRFPRKPPTPDKPGCSLFSLFICLGSMTFVLVMLKLTGHIDWDWYWVLSPYTVPSAVLGLAALAMLITLLIWRAWQAMISAIKELKRSITGG